MDTSSESSVEGETSMKRFTFEQLVIASAPKQSSETTDTFTNDVMNKIHHTSLQKHVSSEPTARNAAFFSRLHHLPTFAVIAITLVMILAITGTAYALTQLSAK